MVSNIFFNLNSAETNDEIQQIAQEVSPLLTEFASKISQNEQLFSRIKKVYDEKDHYTLNEEQKMLLEHSDRELSANFSLDFQSTIFFSSNGDKILYHQWILL